MKVGSLFSKIANIIFYYNYKILKNREFSEWRLVVMVKFCWGRMRYEVVLLCWSDKRKCWKQLNKRMTFVRENSNSNQTHAGTLKINFDFEKGFGILSIEQNVPATLMHEVHKLELLMRLLNTEYFVSNLVQIASVLREVDVIPMPEEFRRRVKEDPFLQQGLWPVWNAVCRRRKCQLVAFNNNNDNSPDLAAGIGDNASDNDVLDGVLPGDMPLAKLLPKVQPYVFYLSTNIKIHGFVIFLIKQ